MLLGELLRKFPIPQATPADQTSKPDETANIKTGAKTDATPTIKQEPMDTNTNDSVSSQIQIKQEPSGPPEKKAKLNNN